MCCVAAVEYADAQEQVVDPDFKAAVETPAYGDGRLVVLGEAGFLSAQLIRFADGREVKFGMNVPGNDNRQFVLNVLHWLSRLMP